MIDGSLGLFHERDICWLPGVAVSPVGAAGVGAGVLVGVAVGVSVGVAVGGAFGVAYTTLEGWLLPLAFTALIRTRYSIPLLMKPDDMVKVVVLALEPSILSQGKSHPTKKGSLGVL